ncbi:hypothetical protein BpHYR1_009542 [Brachionus plicatilis]|uniref:Uncharacterized protein n=1 Tax=Brachionus plicatilis TaxID=10195 RepID=A0A3M7Q2U9_BRAPC|nr:hypothetical protein BpHYR1_009542 [Brachionus plicatilis]
MCGFAARLTALVLHSRWDGCADQSCCKTRAIKVDTKQRLKNTKKRMPLNKRHLDNFYILFLLKESLTNFKILDKNNKKHMHQTKLICKTGGIYSVIKYLNFMIKKMKFITKL